MNKQARVFNVVAKTATIKFDNDEQLYKATMAGNLKFNNKIIKTGDIVYVSDDSEPYHIVGLKERINDLIRPNVANVDQLVIIQSAIEPDLNPTLLNKFLLFYEHYVDNVKIGISKTDMLDKKQYEHFLKIKQDFITSGYEVFELCNQDEFNTLVSGFKNKVVCLVGNSGVGKSTFINKINPELLLRVQEISKSLNRGKHTTTSSSIIKMQDYMIIDTPGFSSLELNFTPIELASAWHDFRKYSLECKFSNCLHLTEPQCEVKNQLKSGKILEFRYNDYVNFVKQLLNNKK